MFSWVKFLKVSLPVATGACAIVATTLLVASFNDKDKLKKDTEDEILKDLEKPTEEFKDETITKQEENEKREDELEQDKDEAGQEQTSEKNKSTRNDEIDVKGRREAVEKLMKDPAQLNIGETTLRGSEDLEEIKLPSPKENPDEKLTPEGISSSENPKSEEGASVSTGDKEKPDSMPGEQKTKIGELGEGEEQLDEAAPTPMGEAEGDTLQEEEDVPSTVQKETGVDDAKDSGQHDENGDLDSQESEAPSGAPQAEEEASGMEGPEGKTKPAEAGEEDSESYADGEGDNSPKGDGATEGNSDTTSLDIDKLKGLLSDLYGHKNSLSAKLGSFLKIS